MIRVVDFGMGNLRSVQKAFEQLELRAEISNDPGELSESSLLVLPGVGAFDRAVENLRKRNLWSVIEDHLKAFKPFLGICLGLQLLFEESREGNRSGFGFFDGDCRRFRHAETVPHMGWNEVKWRNVDDFHDPTSGQPQCFYFVHSFHPVPADESIVAGVTEYGEEFCCAVRSGDVLGVQFHPEKSQFAGLNLLQHYVESVGILST